MSAPQNQGATELQGSHVPEIDFHEANADERIAAFTNIHEMWGGGRELDAFLTWRKSSPQHLRAKTCVGVLDGEVVTSLACYPMTYCVNGEHRKGIAIGAVHTPPDHRGKGYAPRLMAWVEDAETQMGASYSLLYSDIKPEYYGRLGYIRCPNWQAYVPVESLAEISAGAERSSEAVVPESQLPELMQIYEKYHCRHGFGIHRDEAYWQYTIRKRPKDDLFWMLASNGERIGYGRIEWSGGEVRVTDFALSEASEVTLAMLWQTAARRAAQRNAGGLFGGWLPEDEGLRELFEYQPKDAEITMVKPLGGANCSEQLIASCHQLCEIDHI